MKTRDLVAIGILGGPCADVAKRILQQAGAGKREMAAVVDDLRRVAAALATFVDDPFYGALAQRLLDHRSAADRFQARASDAPYQVWGRDLEPDAVKQMKNARKLPVAICGALMPDAHVGYGLPIGGVLATQDAVIPYAVGVDIACRMKLSVLDLPLDTTSRGANGTACLMDRQPRSLFIGRAQRRRVQESLGSSLVRWGRPGTS
jgi:tRNA-splicing ligase RtcB